MTAQQDANDRRTDTNQGPTTVRLDDLAGRADELADDEETGYENRSDVIREAVRRLVTRHECEQRLTEEGVNAPNLDGVVERAPENHPMRADGSGESA